MTLSWFLTAHILEYTSINTCRQTSPHLWWLVFGILCILYLMVLEVVLLGIIVLVVAPILFVSNHGLPLEQCFILFYLGLLEHFHYLPRETPSTKSGGDQARGWEAFPKCCRANPSRHVYPASSRERKGARHDIPS